MTDYRDAIEAQCEGHTYIIREPGDLLEYALQAREVSSDLLQAFCRIHPETSQLYLRSVLDERGVKLVSKSEAVNFLTKKADELSASNYSFSISEECVNADFKNPILMRPTDILHLLDRLQKNNEKSWSESQLCALLNRKEFLQLKLLKFIVQVDSRFELDREITEMFKIMNLDNSFVGLANDIKTKKRYRKYIIKVIRKNEHFSFLIELTRVANKNGMHSAENFLDICCEKNWHEPFIKTFLAGNPSNGILPIKKEIDICFKCPSMGHCLDCRSNNVDEIKEKLLYLRNNVAKKYLDFIKRNRNLEIIKRKPAYQKFLFSYSIVVIIKGFLCNMGVLKKDKILRKDHGQYCPQIDYWRLEDDLLV